MKKVLALCLLVGFVWAFNADRNYIDDGSSSGLPHRALPQRQGAVVLVDSSGNPYSGWTNIQNCLSYSPTLDGLVFVCRGYSPTGVLNVNQTDGSFTFWVQDLSVYNEEFGSARYPTSIASADCHIGFPALDQSTATWGHMGGQQEQGGWYSSFWGTPVDMTGDIGSPRSMGKELPTGDIVYFADMPTVIHYETWTADMATQQASGDFAEGTYLTGADVNNGTLYLFYQSTATLDMFYRTTTDGITWSGATAWAITWPTPFTNNLIGWQQMALTDAGDPIYVFEVSDGDDLTYPVNSKVYVQTASGATPVQLSSDSYAASSYPTVATGGNSVQVIMSVWTNGLEDSLARLDVFGIGSDDNGANWGALWNLTENEPNRPGLPQIAKRIDATNDNFFYFYGINLVTDIDIVWSIGAAIHNLEATGWYIGWHPVTGIEEHETETPSRLTMNITNPASRNAKISYTLTNAGEISLKIYDRTGSLVRTIETGYKEAGIYNLNLDVSELANGTYFARLDTSTDDLTRTFVVIH